MPSYLTPLTLCEEFARRVIAAEVLVNFIDADKRIKSTVMQTEKAMINVCFRISKAS